MRCFLKILSIITLSTLPVTSIVACDYKNINPEPKTETMNISFQEITHFDVGSFLMNEYHTSSAFILMKNMGINPSSNIPKNLFCDNYDTPDKQGCFFYIGSDNVWNQISNIYGFPTKPTTDKTVDELIQDVINTTSLKNVSMQIINHHINQVWSYKLIDFVAQKK